MLTLHVTEEWIALFIPQWTDFRWILNLHSYELPNAEIFFGQQRRFVVVCLGLDSSIPRLLVGARAWHPDPSTPSVCAGLILCPQ
jgi:hypothetical protein